MDFINMNNNFVFMAFSRGQQSTDSVVMPKYVGVAPVEDDGVDFEERMTEIHRELLSLQAESNDLMDTISYNMKEMGL